MGTSRGLAPDRCCDSHGAGIWVPCSALDDVVNRHQRLTEGIERLLRVPDIKHGQLVAGAKARVIQASRRFSGASGVELPDAGVVQLRVHRVRGEVETQCHVLPPSMDRALWAGTSSRSYGHAEDTS